MIADEGSVLLLDGATGTELARRGIDLSSPHWSARAIIDSPEILGDIHREYLQAGAGAITANTFRKHERSLNRTGLGRSAADLTCRAVEIAREVRDQVRRDALVLGSVGPLEDCYEPAHAPRADICRVEHAKQIERLLDAGVDLLLLETLGTEREILAAVEAARELAPGKWIVSALARGGSAGQLISGESFVDLLPMLHDARAVGINCLAAPDVEAEVRLLRRLLPPNVPIAAYGNVGRMRGAGEWTPTDAEDPEKYATYALRWVDAGARIVGGCCGTTPQTIAALATALESRGCVSP